MTDLTVACGLAIGLAIPMLLIAFAVRVTSVGPILYLGRRIGHRGQAFLMPKFRTMRNDAPNLPSHELADTNRWLTPVGRVLRRFSLDELPQLWSVIKGDMSLVGPRPAHPTQHNLIALRKACGVDQLVPGVTGWAQINGRDALDDEQKVAMDVEYMKRRSWVFDAQIILRTVPKAIGARNVSH